MDGGRSWPSRRRVLHGAVEVVDVLVGRRDDADRAALGGEVGPALGDLADVSVEAAGVDAAEEFVVVQGSWVAGAETEGGVGFPAVLEAVEVFEGVDASGGAEFVEQAAAAGGLQLAGVADEDESPADRFGELDEVVQRRR
jgi:hypothetical protein